MRLRVALLLTAGVLAGTPAAAHGASPLIGQWAMDASQAAGATDVTPDGSGNGLDLRAPLGSAHVGPPARFGAGALLGANVTPLRVTSPLLAPARVTLLAWVRQSGNPGTLRYIAGRGDDGGWCGGSTWALYTGYPGQPGLRFYVRTGASGLPALTDAPADAQVFDGQWHLVAGTYDGTAARLYVDGVLVGAPVPAPEPLTYTFPGTSFYVDGYPVESCALGPNADDWPGAIDEVRVYDRALSATELGRLAAAPGPTAPDLVPDAAPVVDLPVVAPSGPPLVTAPPAPPAVAAAGAAPSVGRLLGTTEMKQALGGVAGASEQPPSRPLRAALRQAQPQALDAMKRVTETSRVGTTRRAASMSVTAMRQAQPDARLRRRLGAMRFGVVVPVPADAPGELVEVVATIALQKKRDDGVVVTQTVVLPPAVGIAGNDRVADVVVPVDRKATAAMTSPDVTDAALSALVGMVGTLSGAEPDPVSADEELERRIQENLAAAAEAHGRLFSVIQGLVGRRAGASDRPAGVTASGWAKQESRAKRERRAEASERARDRANRRAALLLAPATARLIEATRGRPLPSASVRLRGCRACRFNALDAK